MKARKLICFLVAFTFAAGLCMPMTALASTQKEFFVSLEGSDSNNGTIDAPFRTLEAARDAVRAMKRTDGLPLGGVRISIREGVYALTQGFELNSEDSGTAESPIIYEAYNGEDVHFVGGVTIPSSLFQPLSNRRAMAKIPVAAQRRVIQADLRELGLDDFKPIDVNGYAFPTNIAPQLYYDNTRMTVARWPNDGFVTYDEIIDVGKITEGHPERYRDPDFYYTGGGAIRYQEDAISSWTGEAGRGMMAEANISYVGYKVFIRVDEINTAEKIMRFENPTPWGITTGDQEYYLYNFLQALDRPGEWYLDVDSSTLYLYPPNDSLEASDIVIAVTEDSIFKMHEVSYITLRGLGMGLTRKHGLEIGGYGDHILIDGCKIYNTGQNGILGAHDLEMPFAVAWWTPDWDSLGITNTTIMNSFFHGIGGTAIELSGGQRKTLTKANNIIENNIISETSLLVGRTAMQIWGVGTDIRHNLVGDIPGFGISYSGNEINIEYNELVNVMYNLEDGGWIYSFGDPSFLGIRINYNLLRNGVMSGHKFGIYLDDEIAGQEVKGNIIMNAMRYALCSKGIYNEFTDNIMIGNGSTISLDGSDFAVGRISPNDYDSWRQKILDMMPADVYSTYPNLRSILDLAPHNGWQPRGNIYDRNVEMGTYSRHEQAHAELSPPGENLELNTLEEIGFVDAASGDYRLRPDSPILQQWPDFDNQAYKAGLYTEKLNTKLKSATALFINSPMALTGGKATRVDVNNIDVAPIVLNERTLLPARFIAESFGGNVDWNADTQQVTMRVNGKNIVLTLNSDAMTVDGREQKLDVPAQTVNGRTLVPLRALVESIGKQVMWDDRGLIYISDAAVPFAEDESFMVDNLVKRFR